MEEVGTAFEANNGKLSAMELSEILNNATASGYLTTKVGGKFTATANPPPTIKDLTAAPRHALQQLPIRPWHRHKLLRRLENVRFMYWEGEGG